MKSTKKLTLSAITVALGTLFIVLGGLIEVLDLTACALASLLVVFVYIEIGSPYTWLVWLCTSLTVFLLQPAKLIWLTYLLIFGIYPILKAYIERTRRPVWLPLKVIYANLVIWAMILIYEFVFKLPLFAIDKMWLKVILYAVMNIAFIAYDLFITVSVRLYFARLRPRFKNLFK